MAASDVIASFYLSFLGRQPDAAGLAGYVAAVNAGLSLEAVQATIRSSPEAQIVAIYRRLLGRTPETAAVQADTAFLTQGGTAADLALSVVRSDEATRNVNTIYNQLLGRNVDTSGLASFKAAQSNGEGLAELRQAIVYSQEGQNTLNAVFQNELGRPPAPTPTAPFSQNLFASGTLFAVRSVIASSEEASNDITRAYQVTNGTKPTATAFDAAESELQSGVSLVSVYREIGQLAGRTLPVPSSNFTDIHIAAFASPNIQSGLTFYSSLGNNDALVTTAGKSIVDQSPNPTSLVDLVTNNSHFDALINTFDPATDYIQLQSYQVASFADLKLTSYGPGPATGSIGPSGTAITLDANNSISIQGVSPNQLQASNFRFV